MTEQLESESVRDFESERKGRIRGDRLRRNLLNFSLGVFGGVFLGEKFLGDNSSLEGLFHSGVFMGVNGLLYKSTLGENSSYNPTASLTAGGIVGYGLHRLYGFFS